MAESIEISEPDFLRLFVKHEGALRAFARVLLPSWQEVDEAMQEASVVMWKKRGQLDSADGFLPWAKVILRFESQRIRREHARNHHIFSEKLYDLLAHEAGEIEEDVWERERTALRDCLKKLSPQHQELVLAPYAGKGHVTRIAAATSRTANSLYKLLGRLREQLAQCVAAKLATQESI